MTSEAEQLIHQIKNCLKSSFWLTPINLLEEKEKFLQSNSYNPQFHYPPIPVAKLKQLLAACEKTEAKSNSQTGSVILTNKLKELSLKIRLLLVRGSPALSQISARLYPCHFAQKTLNQGQKDASLKVKFSAQESLSAQQTAAAIKDYLEKTYSIKNWRVRVTQKQDFYVRIKPHHKLISVSTGINWDFCDLDNTLAHEIDAHVIRAVNAQKQKEPLFRRPLPFYLKTEEGLASFLGCYLSATAELARKHQALKYLAGHLALKNSFRATCNFLIQNGFTPDLAFQRTLRLKRGFEDTSLAGCFTKEAIYYEGMSEVKDFLEKGGDVRKLYAGKVGLQDLKYISIPEDQILPPRLKKYLNEDLKANYSATCSIRSST